MNVTMRVVDQFLAATLEWSRKTGQAPFGIVVMSIGHIGGFQRTPQRGGESDYRADLISAIEASHISQSLFISGLIKVIEIHLVHLALNYDAWRQQAQDDNVDDNEAERKMALLAWREITAPILEYDNLWPIMEDDLKNLPKPPF